MGHSLGTPLRTTPAGKVIQAESGSTIQITWTNGRMSHGLMELGLRADYTIDYQIGAGNVGHSYVTRIGDYLLQSPASYYRRYGWDISPGFKDAPLLDFDRVLGSPCLFCHSNNPVFIGKRRLANGARVEAIDCARCHGDTRRHVDQPSRANVVNPARLALRPRDSVCEQCHLEGVARVLNPGKSWQDIHPGEELEKTLSVYVEDQQGPDARVVSQVEQLALSRCAKESGGKLWCGTCHDPHGDRTINRSSEIKTICTTCHPNLSPTAHASPVSECTSCHMPRLSPNDVPHAASTDHRILARPAGDKGGLSATIRAWREPEDRVKQRNLGLAELEASALPGFQALGDPGARLLEELSAEQQESDPALLAALGDVALSRGRAAQAESLFRRASQLMPSDGEYDMYLGIALKQKGDLTQAAEALQRAIGIDPSLQRAYLELSALYSKQGRVREAADVLNGYSRWNPRSVLVRSTLDGLR